MDRILSNQEIDKYMNKYCFNSMCRGIVKFVGYLEGKEGIWLGIEWDSLERGKHSGIFEGVQYFDCKTGHGSFIRPNKVIFNRGIVDAIVDRYEFKPEKESDQTLNSIFGQINDDLSLKIYAVGLEKHKVKTNEQPLIDLTGYGVSFDDSNGTLNQLITSATELNLSYNLFKSFRELFSMLSQLPSIVTLNISHNPFDLSTIKEFNSSNSTTEDITTTTTTMSVDTITTTGINDSTADADRKKLDNSSSINSHVCFSHIRILLVNRMTSNWSFFENLCQFFPNLTTLSLCYNNFRHLKVSDLSWFHGITNLNLHGNNLTDWSEIESLSSLPCLKTLIVSQNNLSTIYSDKLNNLPGQDYFKSLESIDLSDNHFLQIKNILELSKIKSLKNLQCLGNPFFLCSTKDELYSLRSKIVSLFPNIDVLNGTKIADVERDECEMWFVKNAILEVRHIIHQNEINQSKQSEDSKQNNSMSPVDNQILQSSNPTVVTPMTSTSSDKSINQNDCWQSKSILLVNSINNSDQFDSTILYSLYPNIDNLLNKHKIQLFDLVDSVKLPKLNSTLRSSLWDIHVIFDNQDKTFKIPYTTKVKMLRKLVLKAFKRDISDQQLFYLSRKTSQKYPIEYQDQDLKYNGLENNDLILIGQSKESEK